MKYLFDQYFLLFFEPFYRLIFYDFHILCKLL